MIMNLHHRIARMEQLQQRERRIARNEEIRAEVEDIHRELAAMSDEELNALLDESMSVLLDPDLEAELSEMSDDELIRYGLELEGQI